MVIQENIYIPYSQESSNTCIYKLFPSQKKYDINRNITSLKPVMKKLVFLFLIFSCSNDRINQTQICDENYSPPFGGTIFIDPDIITPEDPTTFVSLSYAGTAERQMYDRRSGWVMLEPFLFPAEYDDGLIIEIQVNPEFGTWENAQVYALKYAEVIGRLTTQLRKDVETSWIHRGDEPFGGGNNNLLIHTDWSEKNYENQGILEETLVHEASHTSLDSYHAESKGWVNAQEMDCEFISNYARDYPIREDISESYLPYLAVRYRSDRITESLRKTIEEAIPNRIKYFDDQNFNMYPID